MTSPGSRYVLAATSPTSRAGASEISCDFWLFGQKMGHNRYGRREMPGGPEIGKSALMNTLQRARMRYT
jgi:hypothetical protein